MAARQRPRLAPRHEYPDGYRPSAYCRSCGRDFTEVGHGYDRHRTGDHEYTFPEGLRMVPPREDGRRCLTDDELQALGLRSMTDDELAASARHRHRLGFAVEVWFDPARAEQARGAFRGGTVAGEASNEPPRVAQRPREGKTGSRPRGGARRRSLAPPSARGAGDALVEKAAAR